jgi:hypothetical protein
LISFSMKIIIRENVVVAVVVVVVDFIGKEL